MRDITSANARHRQRRSNCGAGHLPEQFAVDFVPTAKLVHLAAAAHLEHDRVQVAQVDGLAIEPGDQVMRRDAALWERGARRARALAGPAGGGGGAGYLLHLALVAVELCQFVEELIVFRIDTERHD